MPSCSAAETHLFSSHPTIDASEASVSRAWGPCRPVSPKDSIKASHETRNRPEECLAARWQVGREHCLSRNATKRHDLAIFASHFRGRVYILKNNKKSATWSPAYINETKTPTNFLPHECPWSRDKKPRPGVCVWGVRTTLVNYGTTRVTPSGWVFPLLDNRHNP